MTGLALLAFLGAGHTHRDGEYRETVRRGLEYLLRAQADNGSFAGGGNVYEAMYCHGIAAFAMSEALGMSGDARLREPVRRAVAYTLAAQDPNAGGWRDLPGDPGDTSQLGWQLMALKSADLAGIRMSDQTRKAIMKFLQTVSAGRAAGLASYRPSEQPTRTMTAEALVCWQFLGMRRTHPAGKEAAEYILAELPSPRNVNHYYWYYGTLAMYQLQGEAWDHWRAALVSTLLATQHADGPAAGTWDPDLLWGSYGGRVYSTALSALCLEVFYRFLPLYKDVGGR